MESYGKKGAQTEQSIVVGRGERLMSAARPPSNFSFARHLIFSPSWQQILHVCYHSPASSELLWTNYWIISNNSCHILLFPYFISLYCAVSVIFQLYKSVQRRSKVMTDTAFPQELKWCTRSINSINRTWIFILNSFWQCGTFCYNLSYGAIGPPG